MVLYLAVFFLAITPNTQSTKERNRAVPKFKNKNLYIKGNNPQNGRKYFQVIPNKGLGSGPCKEFLQIDHNKTNLKNISRILIDISSKEDMQLTNKNMSICSTQRTSLIIWEKQFRIIMRYYFTSMQMAPMKNNKTEEKITSVGKSVRNLEPLDTFGGNGK